MSKVRMVEYRVVNNGLRHHLASAITAEIERGAQVVGMFVAEQETTKDGTKAEKVAVYYLGGMSRADAAEAAKPITSLIIKGTDGSLLSEQKFDSTVGSLSSE